MSSFFNVSALGGNPFSTPVGQRIGMFQKFQFLQYHPPSHTLLQILSHYMHVVM